LPDTVYTVVSKPDKASLFVDEILSVLEESVECTLTNIQKFISVMAPHACSTYYCLDLSFGV